MTWRKLARNPGDESPGYKRAHLTGLKTVNANTKPDTAGFCVENDFVNALILFIRVRCDNTAVFILFQTLTTKNRSVQASQVKQSRLFRQKGLKTFLYMAQLPDVVQHVNIRVRRIK